MNLLLLLSALLSALTGAVPGVRGQAAAQAVAQGQVAAQAVAIKIVVAVTRPVADCLSLSDIAEATVLRSLTIISAPIWADRRRE